MEYRYGMRLRGFSIGCQPKEGLDHAEDGIGRYYNILVYNRRLTEKELEEYELDDLNDNESKLHKVRTANNMTVKRLAELSEVKQRQLEYLDGKPGRTNKAAAETVVRIAQVLGCSVADLMD